ncbi:hypothetical protein B7486_71700, partial [cyanobacterium TDX16]
LERGGSLVLVSHDLWMVNALCDHAVVLDEGRIVHEGSAHEAVLHYVEQLRPLPPVAPIGGEASRPPSRVRIEGAVLTGAGGGPPRHGSGATVEVVLAADRPVGDVALRCWLESADQQVGVAELGGIEALEVDRSGLVVEARFDAFPLFAGLVSMRVEVTVAGEVVDEIGAGEHAELVRIEPSEDPVEPLAQMIAAMSSRAAIFHASPLGQRG